jgi:hypothetical protein
MTAAVAQALMEVETLGVELRMEAEKVVMRFPAEELRNELSGQLAFLRMHRHEVMNFLRKREVIPLMPRGVRLVEWNLKEPPVAIEVCAVVVNPSMFARTTLAQLGVALAEPSRWVGWTVPQLIDRLAQVGVAVEVSQETGAKAASTSQLEAKSDPRQRS